MSVLVLGIVLGTGKVLHKCTINDRGRGTIRLSLKWQPFASTNRVKGSRLQQGLSLVQSQVREGSLGEAGEPAAFSASSSPLWPRAPSLGSTRHWHCHGHPPCSSQAQETFPEAPVCM